MVQKTYGAQGEQTLDVNLPLDMSSIFKKFIIFVAWPILVGLIFIIFPDVLTIEKGGLSSLFNTVFGGSVALLAFIGFMMIEGMNSTRYFVQGYLKRDSSVGGDDFRKLCASMIYGLENTYDIEEIPKALIDGCGTYEVNVVKTAYKRLKLIKEKFKEFFYITIFLIFLSLFFIIFIPSFTSYYFNLFSLIFVIFFAVWVLIDAFIIIKKIILEKPLKDVI